MKRKLTVMQRQAILKWFCILLSVSMLVGVFTAVPYIAKAIPKVSSNDSRNLLDGTPAMGKGIPTFALGAGEFEGDEEYEMTIDPEGEFEPESPIPIPTPSENDLPVFSNNFAWYEVSDDATLNIINKTKFSVDLPSLLKKPFPINSAIPNDEPLVLIIHTHGSESYLDNGYDIYSHDETFRSLDTDKNVVHIGELLCEKLNSLGINTVHDTAIYDQTDFNRSYNYSREGIKKALAKYPTIQFVIDLHRDSVFDTNGNNVKPITTLNGKQCAQLMLVIGTNEGGSNHPNWRDNLTFATHLQQKMNDLYPTLARPINLRSAAFNQALTKGSVILEVGACGNTLEEAENAILLFAQAYASLLKENLQ
ncbi:MAG: stage II sporulation protein P [Clostridia bacterium]|nr:stage II sporulation protein P [Clostridia bacterium]